MKNILYILSIIFFGCNNYGCQTENNSRNSTLTEKHDTTNQVARNISKKEIFVAKKFEFKNPEILFNDSLILKVNDKNFLITPFGLFKINSTDTIQLATDLIVNKAYLYDTDEFFYIFFTDTDHDGATSWIQKISKSPLKSEYVKQIQGFNLGQPIIDNQFVYVSAIGFIGKIDLRTGSYEWKHHNLYDNKKYSFNSFDTVLINNAEVEFLSENYQSKKIDKVVVDQLTGEIKEIEK